MQKQDFRGTLIILQCHKGKNDIIITKNWVLYLFLTLHLFFLYDYIWTFACFYFEILLWIVLNFLKNKERKVSKSCDIIRWFSNSMIYHKCEVLLPQHKVVEVFYQPRCFAPLNLLHFPLLVIFFFLSWKVVADCIHTKMGLPCWFFVLTSQI